MTSEGPPISSTRALAEAGVAISAGCLAILAAGAILTVLVPLPPLLPGPWNLLGVLPTAGGAAALGYCALFLARHGRGTPYPRRPPQRLVTTGPYARVRNPIFVSWALFLLGLSITLNFLGTVLVLVPVGGLVHAYAVLHEEPVLAKRFGAEYEAYRKDVPRWVPKLRV